MILTASLNNTLLTGGSEPDENTYVGSLIQGEISVEEELFEFCIEMCAND